MIKLIACLLFIVQVIVYPAYSTSDTTKVGIDSYDPLVIGGSTEVNYVETSWNYTNDDDNSQTLKITIRDTSYSAVENIVGILGSDSSEDGGACEGACENSDSVGSSNYSRENFDYFYAENIMVYLGISLQFSDTDTFYGSASLDAVQISSDTFYTPAEIADGSVDCESKRSSEFVFPLQTSSGEYINADSTTYSGYAEVRLIIINGTQGPFLATCGISI